MSQFPDEPPAGWRTAIRPSGARRVTLDMRIRLDQADAFKGLPRGTAKPLRFLAAFQEDEPYLGLPVHAYKLVAWLLKQTQPQDWEEGSRPIAWPSARHQAEFLGLSPARVKQLGDREITWTPCPSCGCPDVFTAVEPPGEREQPLYPRCCRCGRKRDDLAVFYDDQPRQPRTLFASFALEAAPGAGSD